MAEHLVGHSLPPRTPSDPLGDFRLLKSSWRLPYCSPEFLAEGTAVADLEAPDRVRSAQTALSCTLTRTPVSLTVPRCASLS